MLEQRTKPDFDAVVIGAGITGMYQTWLLERMGLTVRGYEAGSDVGGTWYWNRYPGCRLDTESYAYGYFALNGIIPEWQWSERFAGQAELLRYAQYAADKMDVRRHYEFEVQVSAAHFDDTQRCWRLTLADGREATCRFLLSAVGPLSATRMPAIPGIESFTGLSFHSSRWPRDAAASATDFTGKRVGVIGTGATGVQIIPVVAKTAQQLHVFQRTPNWCAPLGNHALDPELIERLRGKPDAFLDFIKTTETAFPYQRHTKKAHEASHEEREALFESLYDMPGYGIWLSGYRDLLTNRTSNQYLADFIAAKIRSRVADPSVAEKLIPKNHPFGTRRVPLETRYYEVYNQPNVELVDIGESPIERITPNGVVVGGREIELDVLIFATGFDGVTGALDRIDIRGKDGQRLKEVWADGPQTYLGLQITGFPNLFTLVGAHNGASFCNIGVCGALQVEWVARMIEHMHRNGLEYAEADPGYQAAWTEQVYQVYAKTLLADSDAWWARVTQNPDGTVTKRALIYVGSAPDYRAQCEKAAESGYEGFVLN
ncbi:cyclohexanone monooxygenase [Burkholderia sp. SRS-W-2-2016]|uniref:flavin-containing monooxygenase n=1 Tax=Burkholderia sp. SRS-W-2-2016 TaxID=1926878 RepID=UPI00094AAC18|nr:NAD(P)/FAD-dependent oxidoreductase [Burkholderia sp. SRS-W-2-2016]OLL31085.1 cyclohexanone monooxygenase [Burkholderia sp. SRS-W-2-2016]